MTQIIARVAITVPEDATHYRGDLLDDDWCTFYKRKDVAGHEHWWWFDRDRNGWYLAGHAQPPHLRSLEDVADSVGPDHTQRRKSHAS